MRPVAAARPAGHPAAVPAVPRNPAVAWDLLAAVPVVPAVRADPVDSVADRVAAASAEAVAADGRSPHRAAVPARQTRGVSFFSDGLLAGAEPDAGAQKLLGIDRVAVDPRFIMQMRTGRSAG